MMMQMGGTSTISKQTLHRRVNTGAPFHHYDTFDVLVIEKKHEKLLLSHWYHFTVVVS